MTTVSVRGTMAAHADDTDLPAWVRVGCLAWARADLVTGHARFDLAELRQVLGLNEIATSKAVALARDRGWIDRTSTARCVVLPGYGSSPCEERHRD